VRPRLLSDKPRTTVGWKGLSTNPALWITATTIQTKPRVCACPCLLAPRLSWSPRPQNFLIRGASHTADLDQRRPSVPAPPKSQTQPGKKKRWPRDCRCDGSRTHRCSVLNSLITPWKRRPAPHTFSCISHWASPHRFTTATQRRPPVVARRQRRQQTIREPCAAAASKPGQSRPCRLGFVWYCKHANIQQGITGSSEATPRCHSVARRPRRDGADASKSICATATSEIASDRSTLKLLRPEHTDCLH